MLGNPRTVIDLKTFIAVWQKAKKIEEVCKYFGISKETASSKASLLRTKKGIPLKYFRQRFSHQELVEFARKMRDKHA